MKIAISNVLYLLISVGFPPLIGFSINVFQPDNNLKFTFAHLLFNGVYFAANILAIAVFNYYLYSGSPRRAGKTLEATIMTGVLWCVCALIFGVLSHYAVGGVK